MWKCGFHINIKFSTFPGRRKVEIFATWQLHPCDGNSTEQAAQSGWGLAFLAHPHPTSPRVPAGIRVFHASFSHRTQEVAGAISSPLFPPLNPKLPLYHYFSSIRVYRIPPGIGGGAERRGLPRKTDRPSGFLGGYLQGTGKAPLPLKMLPASSASAWCSKRTELPPAPSQVENRSALSSLCVLEGITLLFWAADVPSIQWGGLWERS